MQYGVNNAPKVLCAKHEQAYPKGERCPWCEPVAAVEVTAEEALAAYFGRGWFPSPTLLDP